MLTDYLFEFIAFFIFYGRHFNSFLDFKNKLLNKIDSYILPSMLFQTEWKDPL